MRIQVVSDIHREVDPDAGDDVVDLGADLVILAGDIDHGGAGVRWAAETWPDTPVVYVAGNHEPYGSSIGVTLERACAAAAGTHVHVLEREAVTIGGVRILGATLWSDLRLKRDPAFARAALGHAFPDHQVIEHDDGGRLRPEHSEAIHHATVAWLDEALAEPHAGPTIVVTHHAPSARALLQWDQWAGDPMDLLGSLDAAFASNLEWLIHRHAPALWIHGHTHASAEYWVERTRVISNQRGYEREASGWDPMYLVDVER